VSPQSKGRKRTKTAARSGPTQAPAPDMITARVAKEAFPKLEDAADALDAELYVSQLLGAWWGPLESGVGPEVALGGRLVSYAARRRRTGAVALLRAIAVLGTDREREQAAAAADALVVEGVAEPDWVRELGTDRLAEAWTFRDVYGDQERVALVVDRGGIRHGVVFLLDHTFDHAMLDAYVTSAPSDTFTQLREPALGPRPVVDQLTPAAAAALLVPALQATDAAVATGAELPIGDGFRWTRAVAAARMRLLPAPPAPVPEPEPMDAVARAAVVNEFLASAEARDLPAEAGAVADLVVEFGSTLDPARPLRVGPFLMDRFLDEVVNGEPMLTEDEEDALPETVRAWARWAGKQAELPEPALAHLVDAVDAMLSPVRRADLGDDFDDVELFGAADPTEITSCADAYLEGLDLDAMEPEGLTAVIERRMFAMPFVSTRVGDEEFPHLDPGDPDDRGMLIEGEHPEYHAALADPDSDTVEGVSPRLHITMHEIIANQLWDDNPPEAWQAAQRLLACGADRHDVLHAIGHVLIPHLHTALAGSSVDVEGYRVALDALGRTPAEGGATVTPLRRKR
jgi:Domain of unknown function (DUF1841)